VLFALLPPLTPGAFSHQTLVLLRHLDYGFGIQHEIGPTHGASGVGKVAGIALAPMLDLQLCGLRLHGRFTGVACAPECSFLGGRPSLYNFHRPTSSLLLVFVQLGEPDDGPRLPVEGHGVGLGVAPLKDHEGHPVEGHHHEENDLDYDCRLAIHLHSPRHLSTNGYVIQITRLQPRQRYPRPP